MKTIIIASNSDAGCVSVYRLINAFNETKGEEKIKVFIQKGTKQHKVINSMKRCFVMLEELTANLKSPVNIRDCFFVEIEK